MNTDAKSLFNCAQRLSYSLEILHYRLVKNCWRSLAKYVITFYIHLVELKLVLTSDDTQPSVTYWLSLANGTILMQYNVTSTISTAP